MMTMTALGPPPLGHQDFEWAIDIVKGRFAREISSLINNGRLDERYERFRKERDPILFPLTEGMGNFQLSSTFVSFAVIFDTLATQTRFWLESTVAEIILKRPERFGVPVTHLYTQNSLAQHGIDPSLTVASMGEFETEHLSNKKKWEVVVKRNSLTTARDLVDDYRTKYVKQDVKLKQQDPSKVTSDLAALDHANLEAMARSVSGIETDDFSLNCDLLVIGPDQLDGKAQAHAIRFINPKTFKDTAARSEHRLNLLRLYAYLVQEKIERIADTIEVCVAEIVPRPSSPRFIQGFPFFSPKTYWANDRLWDSFIGVPFRYVEWAIRDAGQSILAERLMELLPPLKHP